MKVEVVYVNSFGEFVVIVDVPESACVKDAIIKSGLLEKHPEISLHTNQVGIFSSITSLDAPLKLNDRVEIYRPLKMDPMQARRLRAESQK